MGEVLGERCYNLSNNGVPCELCAVRNAIESGTSRYVLRRDVLPDGTVRYMDDYAIPLKKDGESSFDYILEIMINRTGEMLLRERTNEMLLNIVKTLVSVLDKKDPYTSEHSRDVSAICARFMKFLGFDGEEVFVARLAGLLHDIGKVYIPDDVINKPARLSDEEYTPIKAHSVAVEEIVRNSGTQFDPFLVEHFAEMTKTLYPTQEALTAPLDPSHEQRKARAEVENDIRHLIDMLYNLMKNLDSRITRNTLEISMECNSFGEYVEKIQAELSSPGAM